MPRKLQKTVRGHLVELLAAHYPRCRVRSPNRLAAGQRGTRGGNKLALSHSTIYSITAAPDLILRLAQHRQKADYFVDAAKAFVIKAVNAHKITNLVTMLSHAKPTNIG